jgi:tRNA (guanine-N7-)-methyltransferase
MGRKNKLGRIEDVKRFPNVFEYKNFKENPDLKGKWHTHIFENDHPITLELACGKGEYTTNLARKYPGRNFIGIDIKGPRIWVGAKQALEEPLENVRFLRTFIDHLENFFVESEVDEIWIPFSDPYLKKERKRLTAPKFLDIYRKILKPGGLINVKTDSTVLYKYTLDIIEKENCTIVQKIDDVYSDSHDLNLLTTIQTYYEQGHLEAGKTIHYVSFRFGDKPATSQQ